MNAASTTSSSDTIRSILFGTAATVGLATVVPTMVIFIVQRKTKFTSPIYELWIAYLLTRVALQVNDFHRFGDYLPSSFRDSLFCTDLLGIFRTFMTIFAYYVSFLQCLYQGAVILMPLKFYSWQGRSGFRKFWRHAMAVSTLISVMLTVLSSMRSQNLSCTFSARLILRPNTVITKEVSNGVLLFAFGNQVLMALLFIFYGCFSVCKCNHTKLTKQQANQVKVAMIGFISFIASFTGNMMYAFAPSLIGAMGQAGVLLLYFDRAGDPIWHFWRNTVFRKEVIRTFRSMQSRTGKTSSVVSANTHHMQAMSTTNM